MTKAEARRIKSAAAAVCRRGGRGDGGMTARIARCLEREAADYRAASDGQLAYAAELFARMIRGYITDFRLCSSGVEIAGSRPDFCVISDRNEIEYHYMQDGERDAAEDARRARAVMPFVRYLVVAFDEETGEYVNQKI